MKPPRIQKRHKKASEKQVRRTCWRSIKWKIAILCCSTQSRKGGGCNNIFLITFLLSQVYLLHRFGLHRKDQFDQLTNQKRSYPIPQNLQLENSNLPVPSELRNPENAVRTVNIKPDRLLFHDQEGKSIEMEKSQNAQSSTTKITSSKSSSSTIVSPTSPKSTSPSSSISASSVQSSSTSIISSSKISTISSTSSSSSSEEAKDAPANMYDSIEYEYNAMPVKETGEPETPASLNNEDSNANSQKLPSDENNNPENGQSEEMKVAEEDGEEEETSELENPGDYYLNEGDDDETTTNSKNLLDSPSLTSIFFDIPDPGSFPPGT